MKFMKIFGQLALGLAVATLLGLSASAQSNGQMGNQGQMNQMGMKNSSTSSEMSAADKHFVMEAAQGGMAEVELGQLAQQKASNPEVKQFGERMVNDHTKANDQLKQVASSIRITLPTGLSAKDEALKEKLSNLSGEQFDKTYMEHMVTDHTQDVAAFRHESADGQDAAVKNFASETLPTLESHLKEARKIEPQVKKGEMSSNQ